MRDNHKLTVAIPTYNRANYLRYAIDSVLSQSYEDFELIILDNASEDDTKSVVEFFKDDRIQYIRNNINIGMEKNFNKAIEESKGEYLIVLSDDDVMDSNLLMEEVNILDNNTDVIVVSANCSIIDENGFIFQEKCMNMDNDVIFDRFDYIKQSLEGRYFLPFPATMIKLTMLRQEGIKFNTSVGPCCDAYLWYELNTYSKKIYLLKKPLLQYRKHSERYTIKSGGLYYENLILWEHTFNNKAISEDPYIRTLIQKRINRIMLDLLDKVIYEQNEELFIRCLTKINNLIENNGLLLEPKIFLISYFDNYFLNLDGINPLLSTTVSKLYYKWYTLARLG
ncbi:MAG: glycosyltransferase family 2 protein, partial [Firmicutes bacterium]|nr:glycosyltransferase family 2 protein [Bacillota bacterium]